MKHHRNFTIAIDFDDTIVEGAFPGIGKLKKDADKYINMLYDQGCNIIINTLRNCCLLKDKSAGGYIWKYFKQEKIEIMNNVKLKIKKIC